MEKPKSVKAYLSGLDRPQRDAVERLRDTIASVVPDAEEAIAWSMPAFRLRGKAFVGYCAFKDHYSFFPDEHRRDRAASRRAR
jgi:uncharacterized protein YdhG (YjbR/CyaY superfamily)